MKEIISVQYRVAEYIINYFQQLEIPNYGLLVPEYYDISQLPGVLFITVFLLSLLSWFLGRMFCSVFKTYVYNIENYRTSVLINIFYVVPFLYGFFWWKLRSRNIFILFVWNCIFFVIWFPEVVINLLK